MKNKSALESFKQKCRDSNLRITPQRIAIFQELVNDYSHPCADDVYRKIVKKNPNISFDTVNRTLLLFANQGMIKFAESYGKTKRFDPDVESHHHLCCIRCGRIIDFYNKEYDEIKIPNSIKNKYTVFGKRVVIEGLCDKCKTKNKVKGNSYGTE